MRALRPVRRGRSVDRGTVEARKALSAIARTGERFGAGYIADVLLGRETDPIRRNGHAALKTFGAGRDKTGCGLHE
jgi:ATP-dependent DNA helicase RecQ